MAKATKSANNPAPTDGAAEAAAPAKKVVNIKEPNKNDVFIRVMGPDGKGAPLTKKNAKGEVVPCNTPQIKVIANLLETAGEKGMTRGDLVAQLPAAGLVTRQPVSRIVSYYQKPMVENGMITITKGAPEVATAA